MNYFQTRYSYDKSRSAVWKAVCEYLQKELEPNSTVLEIGPGYCDFINQIKASKKYALDKNPEIKEFSSPDVEHVNYADSGICMPDASVDNIFASNVFEHLSSDEMDSIFKELRRVLRPKGKIIILQPNYHYCYRQYWDDYTHKKAFTHISLCDYLNSERFKIIKVIKRFLPFSIKSRLPKSYFITKLYLMMPFKLFAKQMLIIAQRED